MAQNRTYKNRRKNATKMSFREMRDSYYGKSPNGMLSAKESQTLGNNILLLIIGIILFPIMLVFQVAKLSK